MEADRSAALNAQVEEALQETRQVVEKYSNEAVEQWNREIDGLLTFVSDLSVFVSFYSCIIVVLEWPILSSSHCFQCPIVSTTSTLSHRPDQRCSRTDLQSNRGLLTQPILCQFHASSIRYIGLFVAVSGPALCHPAQHTLVLEPRPQSCLSCHRDYSQAMVKRIQLWLIRNGTRSGPPASISPE